MPSKSDWSTANKASNILTKLYSENVAARSITVNGKQLWILYFADRVPHNWNPKVPQFGDIVGPATAKSVLDFAECETSSRQKVGLKTSKEIHKMPRTHTKIGAKAISQMLASVHVPHVIVSASKSVTSKSLNEEALCAEFAKFTTQKHPDTSKLFPIGTHVIHDSGIAGVVIKHNPNDYNAPTVINNPSRLQPDWRCVRLDDGGLRYFNIKRLSSE